MKKASPGSQSFVDHIRSWARTNAHGPSPLSADSRRPTPLPLISSTRSSTLQKSVTSNSSNASTAHPPLFASKASNVADNTSIDSSPPAPPPQDEGQGSIIDLKTSKKNIAIRFYETGRGIVLSSWINVLLIFVPVGIAIKFVPSINPTIIFVMNAAAIIPLAGLLSHATESVAQRMGDTIGALMNISFGNAVEIIVFMYVYLNGDQDKKEREAQLKDEIAIVQASLVGSILANLLLILGMCFLVGGLRFRAQIYNSTITQMSACLLSLSVMSLLLPTAFHASFTDTQKADSAVLKVSRGTSVILLIVYGMYLLFQLKSHAYMYESTPQHIIDLESAPGPLSFLASSSDGDSSSGSDSDISRGSNTTVGRIRRVLKRDRKNRKSSAGSRDTDQPGPIFPDVCTEEPVMSPSSSIGHQFGAGDVNDDDDDDMVRSRGSRTQSFNEKYDKRHRRGRKHKRKHHDRNKKLEKSDNEALNEKVGESSANNQVSGYNEPRRVDFAMPVLKPSTSDPAQKKTFTIRGIDIRPAITKTFSPNVFSQPVATGSPHIQIEPPINTGPSPRMQYGIRRTNSLPDRLNLTHNGVHLRLPPTSLRSTPSGPSMLVHHSRNETNISRTTAVVLLLISTSLVALCAEFMVSSINAVTTDTPLGETFVGLILLPIVGNAAEHVTAVAMAHKNKMDLAIGVAVGSSIQIALFITPFIVLLAFCLDKPLSLYFSLFETVCLLSSVLTCNFLILDGKSTWLEGVLLLAAYLIVSVAAFYM